MAIDAQDLTALDALLSPADADGAVLAILRRQFAHLSFARCDAEDVETAPFRSYPRFDLHLMDNRDHCLTIVADPAFATGVILGWRRPGR